MTDQEEPKENSETGKAPTLMDYAKNASPALGAVLLMSQAVIGYLLDQANQQNKSLQAQIEKRVSMETFEAKMEVFAVKFESQERRLESIERKLDQFLAAGGPVR